MTNKDYLKELTQLQHELARLENNVSTVIRSEERRVGKEC